LILVELGAGILLLMPLVPITEVRRSYFSFHSILAAICFVLAAVAIPFSPSTASIIIALAVSVLCCFAGYAASSMDQPRATRWILAVAASIALGAGVISLIQVERFGMHSQK